MYTLIILAVSTVILGIVYYFGVYTRFYIKPIYEYTTFKDKIKCVFAFSLKFIYKCSLVALCGSIVWFALVGLFGYAEVCRQSNNRDHIVERLDDYAEYAENNSLNFEDAQNIKELIFEANQINKIIDKSNKRQSNKFINWYYADYGKIQKIDVTLYKPLVY